MASNRNALKNYAPQARLDFIQAMTNRAAQFGITKAGITQGKAQGELYILNGKAFPRAVASQRDRLESRISHEGFDQVIEAIAYTWFNRFLAIRYMEIHDYFEHGLRVLSHPEGHSEPQILEQVAKVELPGLNRDEIVSLKLDGTKDEQIYRKILIAQCNDLHRAMPFLFERIDDETELLLPENLLQSDSIIRKLVNEIDEAEWQEIEIIGWLYQYYISDKKDEVIGKVVKSEDIPAATQLFTPNWIVKYMVQNSLGAQWMATYPESALRGEMEYYIAPAEQTPEVQVQLDAITPKELDPEAITLIDPAVGSGHILVEAYNLFRTIYLERGFTRKEAARAILTKNLFGLDIDTRAAQMAGFALLMKARADDRSLLRDPPRINVLAIKDSREMDANTLNSTLAPSERFEIIPSGDLLPETLPQPALTARRSNSKEGAAIRALIALFAGADTFGSLITIPQSILDSLDMIEALLSKPLSTDLLKRQAQVDARDQITPLINQARLLGARYDCVVANPPYGGSRYMNNHLRSFARENYDVSKADLYTMFIERGFSLCRENGRASYVCPFVWMYTSTFEEFRKRILQNSSVNSLIQLEYNAFEPAMVPVATFSLLHSSNINGVYIDLGEFKGHENQSPRALAAIADSTVCYRYQACSDSFARIPGSPIAYKASPSVRRLFASEKRLGNFCDFTGSQNITGNNGRYTRMHWEISSNDIGKSRKWIIYAKGGGEKKWFGFLSSVVDWSPSARKFYRENPTSNLLSEQFWFRAGITYSMLTSNTATFRVLPSDCVYDKGGPSFHPNPDDTYLFLSLCNSNVAKIIFNILNPTLNLQVQDVKNLPIHKNIFSNRAEINEIVEKLIAIAEDDWNTRETSSAFSRPTALNFNSAKEGLLSAVTKSKERRANTQELEIENNKIVLKSYGLGEDVSPDVKDRDVFLEETDVEIEAKRIVSFAIGCIMGRYSLSEPGLIYAQSGGLDFDPSRYSTFPADGDGIIPITDIPWFEDDAATRIETFLGIVWPEVTVIETLATLTDDLTQGKSGEPREVLRGYMSKQFFKDHLQTYKNRPIYWLFSSGKQKAFEALVYLHRYNEGTLARMRTNYVTPLMGKLQQRINDLNAEVASSASSAEKARKTKEKDRLGKQLVELRRFDEELRHLADQRIPIDLDDGVKVNYAKFGNLLSGVDKICGKDKDD
jgi:hypothetical protein